MKYITILITVLAITMLLISACAAPASSGDSINDIDGLIDALRAGGATVEPADDVDQPFFMVTGKILRVNGADVQVFVYSDEASAQADADTVDPEGSAIGTSMVTWIAPPHFYKSGALIVLYVGTDGEVMSLLESVLGNQFAGG